MTRKFLLMLIMIIFFVSCLTLYLILNYFDPYRNEVLAITTLSVTFLLTLTSFGGMSMYVFKKVYYRGEIYLSHIFSSLRQAFLLSLFIYGSIAFMTRGLLWVATMLLLFSILFFIELLFQNL